MGLEIKWQAVELPAPTPGLSSAQPARQRVALLVVVWTDPAVQHPCRDPGRILALVHNRNDFNVLESFGLRHDANNCHTGGDGRRAVAGDHSLCQTHEGIDARSRAYRVKNVLLAL